MTHIFVGNSTIIGSDNCLPPGRRQAIIWTDTGISLTAPPPPPRNRFQWNLNQITYISILENFIWKCRLEDGGHFVLASVC